MTPLIFQQEVIYQNTAMHVEADNNISAFKLTKKDIDELINNYADNDVGMIEIKTMNVYIDDTLAEDTGLSSDNYKCLMKEIYKFNLYKEILKVHNFYSLNPE